MRCPHCLKEIDPGHSHVVLPADHDGYWRVDAVRCPSCRKNTLTLETRTPSRVSVSLLGLPEPWEPVLRFRPLGSGRPPAPEEVRTESPGIAADYEEACEVSHLSPRASAALSRRCLQSILRTRTGVRHADLAVEILEALDKGHLPAELAVDLAAVPRIGNFAGHPAKSSLPGQVCDADPGETELNLDVIEGLFDFYYVQPARLKARRDALEHRLGEPE
ncbi:MAG: DUF4145 domain-containing protein [bacterium]